MPEPLPEETSEETSSSSNNGASSSASGPARALAREKRLVYGLLELRLEQCLLGDLYRMLGGGDADCSLHRRGLDDSLVTLMLVGGAREEETDLQIRFLVVRGGIRASGPPLSWIRRGDPGCASEGWRRKVLHPDFRPRQRGLPSMVQSEWIECAARVRTWAE